MKVQHRTDNFPDITHDVNEKRCWEKLPQREDVRRVFGGAIDPTRFRFRRRRLLAFTIQILTVAEDELINAPTELSEELVTADVHRAQHGTFAARRADLMTDGKVHDEDGFVYLIMHCEKAWGGVFYDIATRPLLPTAAELPMRLARRHERTRDTKLPGDCVRNCGRNTGVVDLNALPERSRDPGKMYSKSAKFAQRE